MSIRTLLRYAHERDLELADFSYALAPSGADAGLRRLSQFADHSRLWLVVAAALAASGGSRRRAAVRGLLSVVGASSVANGLLKPLFPRSRPPVKNVPMLRRILDPPVSSSFPSGHSASAAAFAVGVALESPVSGAVVAPLAAAVAYSRVHVGVHWPSDVIAGAALGTAIALSTRRWWAVRVEDPTALGEDGTAPALVGGTGLLVLVNPSAGQKNADVVAQIVEALPNAKIFEADSDSDFAEQLRGRIDGSVKALGVCGGDGTVATAVGVALDTGLPLAVFPGGTLNHFARDVGSTDVVAVGAGIERGAGARVDIGAVVVDGAEPRYFINTASLGGYPDSVRMRDKWEPRLGKWPAAAAAMIAVLWAAEPLRLDVGGTAESTWMFFVGNGHYVPADQVPMSRPSMSGGKLDVRYLRAGMRLSRLRLLFAVATGNLGKSPTYTHSRTPSITVSESGDPVALAVDGEVYGDGRQFEFDCRPSALTLYRAV